MSKEQRVDVWLYVIVPIAVLWGLLLFAPPSSSLAIVERLSIGSILTVLYGPLMWLRIRN